MPTKNNNTQTLTSLSKKPVKKLQEKIDFFEFTDDFQLLLSASSIDDPTNRQELEAQLEMKQHQICLSCQENGATWSKYKKLFKRIQITFFSLSLIISLVSFAFAVWLLFFSEYNQIVHVLKFFDEIKLFTTNYINVSIAVFAFLIEIITILLDLVQFILIWLIFRVFKASNVSMINKKKIKNKNNKKSKTNNLTLNNQEEQLEDADEDIIFYPAQSMKETINRLKRRINIRNRFKLILKALKRLDLFINLYYVLIILVSKVIVATLIGLTIYTNLFDSGDYSLNRLRFESPKFNHYDSNSFSIDPYFIEIDNLGSNFTCCLKNYTLEFNNDENLTGRVKCLIAEFDWKCFIQLNQFYIIGIIIYLLLSAIIKLTIHIILSLNVRKVLFNKLVLNLFSEELAMFNMYEKCRQILIRLKVNQNREINQKLLVESLKSADLYSKKIQDMLDNLKNEPKTNQEIGSADSSEINDTINLIEQAVDDNGDFISFSNSRNNNHPVTSTFKKSNF